MPTPNDIELTNQFGEKSFNKVSDFQEFSDKLPAKTGLEAIDPIADPSTADAEECADKINEILAALKATS